MPLIVVFMGMPSQTVLYFGLQYSLLLYFFHPPATTPRATTPRDPGSTPLPPWLPRHGLGTTSEELPNPELPRLRHIQRESRVNHTVLRVVIEEDATRVKPLNTHKGHGDSPRTCVPVTQSPPVSR